MLETFAFECSVALTPAVYNIYHHSPLFRALSTEWFTTYLPSRDICSFRLFLSRAIGTLIRKALELYHSCPLEDLCRARYLNEIKSPYLMLIDLQLPNQEYPTHDQCTPDSL